MKYIIPVIYIFFLIQPKLYSSTSNDYFKYTDPRPDAKYVNPATNIILTPKEIIDVQSLFNDDAFTVTGSLSGKNNYKVIYNYKVKTVILELYKTFRLNETVNISFNNNIKLTDGQRIKPFSYTFQIKSKDIKLPKNYIYQSEFNFNGQSGIKTDNFSLLNDSTFPKIKINYYNGPSPGRFFFSNFTFSPQTPNTTYLIILNNNGQPFYKKMSPVACFDFNVQPNGNPTYFCLNGLKYYELNNNYNIADSFYCGQNDGTDLHELRVLPNRHALLMSYDPESVDMSVIVPGGNPNAIVTGLIIQEIDEWKNVVFRWRSWDHIPVTDASHQNLTDTLIDYVHGNAIELDYDWNILISSRHLDEITKISRSTGNIIWRLGGKRNQFNFTNDPIKFNYQHGIRRLSNGNIILYDNGNFHTPPFSRAVEYKLDEVNKTATLIWQYRNNPDVFGFAMGFAQRLDNGNTVICWGSVSNPAITEVKYDGTKVFELSLPNGVFTYRAFKYKWQIEKAEGNVIPDKITLEQNYPNPFNPSTTIKFGIPDRYSDNSPVNVKLALYDITGRLVSVILEKELFPDTYTAEFNSTNLASGIYFYQLKCWDYVASKKLVIKK